MRNIVSEKILERFFNAAEMERWEEIDDVLMPELRVGDGNQLALGLLEEVESEDPNFRDAVATGLAGLTLSDESVHQKAIEAMIKMTTNDPEVFPAGRAAVFLMDPSRRQFDHLIKPALKVFLGRVGSNSSWKGEIEENIPTLNIEEMTKLVNDQT
jgi:hypothetical protein